MDVSDIFNFFFCLLGKGEGGVEAPEGGGGSVSLLKSPGGGLQDGRGRGAGRVSAANLGIGGGGGPKYFFRGRNVHQVFHTK